MVRFKELKIHCDSVGEVLNDERLESCVRLRDDVMATAALVVAAVGVVAEDGGAVVKVVEGGVGVSVTIVQTFVGVRASQVAVFLWC
jgi:hypothetical protein